MNYYLKHELIPMPPGSHNFQDVRQYIISRTGQEVRGRTFQSVSNDRSIPHECKILLWSHIMSLAESVEQNLNHWDLVLYRQRSRKTVDAHFSRILLEYQF